MTPIESGFSLAVLTILTKPNKMKKENKDKMKAYIETINEELVNLTTEIEFRLIRIKQLLNEI